MTFREVLRVPGWWFGVALLAAVAAAAEIDLGQPGWAWKVPYAVFPAVTLWALLSLSRKRVLVEHGVLHVPGARAPLDAFGTPEVLDREALRLYLGPAARPEAWVVTTSWLRQAVLLPVTDPDEDTPYWLIGSRDPAALAAALTS